MRIIVMTIAFGFVAGCMAENSPPSDGPDMEHVITSGNGGSGGSGGGGGQAGGDMATAAHDLAGGGTVGTKAFGDLCAVDGDCMSGMCRPFVMGSVHRCTQPCNAANPASTCPSPPSTGTCTNAQPPYCKFTQ
jgi:hypothetical protein